MTEVTGTTTVGGDLTIGECQVSLQRHVNLLQLGHYRLIFATLETGIRGASMHVTGQRRPGTKIDYEWLINKDTSWPFSFDNCCLAFSFDPSAMRKMVLAGGGPLRRQRSA